MGNLLCDYFFLLIITVDIITCSFSEHEHGTNDTIHANTIVDMINGGSKKLIVKVLVYSFLVFVCLVVITHLYLKYRHEKHLKKNQNDHQYVFEWEEAEK